MQEVERTTWAVKMNLQKIKDLEETLDKFIHVFE